MEWSQVMVLAGVNITLIAAMTSIVVWAINKMVTDIKNIGTRLDGNASRIDQLYHMFIYLLKDNKK